MMCKDKKRKTDHHVIGMVESMSQKNVEMYNENRWEIMKYNSTINRVKPT